jgi:tRNA-dihydrouridine synthase
MYSGHARWEEIASLKDASDVPVVGNGDVRTGQDALDMVERTGCDGVMIARGSHGRPWLFAQARAALNRRDPLPDPGVEERFRVCLRHARNAIAFEGDASKAVIEFRKHIGWYTKGLPGGRKIRAELHRVNRLEEIEGMLQAFLADLDEDEARADQTGAAA